MENITPTIDTWVYSIMISIITFIVGVFFFIVLPLILDLFKRR